MDAKDDEDEAEGFAQVTQRVDKRWCRWRWREQWKQNKEPERERLCSVSVSSFCLFFSRQETPKKGERREGGKEERRLLRSVMVTRPRRVALFVVSSCV